MQNPVGLRDERRQGPRRAGRHLGRCSRTRSRSRRSRTRSRRASWWRPALIISASAWHLARNQHLDTMRPALKFGAVDDGGRRHPHDALRRPAEPRDGRDAADEDGGRRGDCTTRSAVRMPRSRSSPSARPTARASCSRSACRTCSRSSRRTRSTAASRASTTCRRSTSAALRPRRLRADHLGHLLGVPLDDRPRPAARARRGRRPLAHPQGRAMPKQAGSGRSRSGASRSRSPR